MAKVLVVDDDPVILKLLEVNFEMEGYDVTTASDGVEALAAIEADLPDVIVSDVMMPRMDGLELAAALKGDPALRSIPLMLLSAKAQTTDVSAGMELADDYVTKPFDPLDLLERVSALVR